MRACLPLSAVRYDPWGQVETGTPPPFGFTGELQQGGNVNLRARWYNAVNGTFTSKDPFAGTSEQPYSQHPYAYAFSNPVLYIDPTGQRTCNDDSSNPSQCSYSPASPRTGTARLPTAGPTSEPTPSPSTVPVPGPTPSPTPVGTPTPPDYTNPNQVLEFTNATAQLIWDLWRFTHAPQVAVIKGQLDWYKNPARNFSSNGQSNIISACSDLLIRAGAYTNWVNLVKTGGTLDVKGKYLKQFGPTIELFQAKSKWPYQLSGNLLYGFIGIHVGFSIYELLGGGGAAQYFDHCIRERSPDIVGPGAPGCTISDPSPLSWDQQSDQAEIAAGALLYQMSGPLFMTPFRQQMRAKYAQLERVLTVFRKIIPEREK